MSLESPSKKNEELRGKNILGAIAVGAVVATSPSPEGVYAQTTTEALPQMQQTAEGVRTIRSGEVIHPQLGKLMIEVYYKHIDTGAKEIVPSSPYGVRINGQERKVTSARFLRNGAGNVEIEGATPNTKETLRYSPSYGEGSSNPETYTHADGSVSTIQKK